MPELECRDAALLVIASTPGSIPGAGESCAPAARHDAPAMRWLVPALTMHPLSTERCCVRNPLNGVAVVLSSGECAVLAACIGCHTLAEHVDQAATVLNAPAAHRPAMRDCLELCAELGLLNSLPGLIARCGAPEASALPPLGAVAIRTADRPTMLERLLVSAAALQARTGVSYPWQVIDDSRLAASRRANREALARRPELAVTYHDLSDTTPLEAELTAAFPSLAAEIGWLLGPPCGDEATYGRPLNYALLRFAGRRLLVIDDDALLQPRRSPVNGHAFAIARPDDELRWYADLDAAWKDCPELDLDPLAEHARWLGLSLAQAWPRVLREEQQLGRHRYPSAAR